jgi:hypothetical protein
MTETPDFNGESDRHVRAIVNDPSHAAAHVQNLGVTLRLIRNERGAADIAQLENELVYTMGLTAASPYLKNLQRALRKLDR